MADRQAIIDALMGTWPMRMGQSMLQGAMAPGNAYASTPDNPVTTEQMIGPAANLASIPIMGAMPFGVGGNALGSGAMDAFSKAWNDKGIRNFVAERAKQNQYQLSDLVVPKEQRGQGIGSQFMKGLIDLADQEGRMVTLTAAKDYGSTSLGRLKDFYKQFGFVENKGRNKDFAISDTMYRMPFEKY